MAPYPTIEDTFSAPEFSVPYEPQPPVNQSRRGVVTMSSTMDSSLSEAGGNTLITGTSTHTGCTAPEAVPAPFIPSSDALPHEICTPQTHPGARDLDRAQSLGSRLSNRFGLHPSPPNQLPHSLYYGTASPIPGPSTSRPDAIPNHFFASHPYTFPNRDSFTPYPDGSLNHSFTSEYPRNDILQSPGSSGPLGGPSTMDDQEFDYHISHIGTQPENWTSYPGHSGPPANSEWDYGRITSDNSRVFVEP